MQSVAAPSKASSKSESEPVSATALASSALDSNEPPPAQAEDEPMMAESHGDAMPEQEEAKPSKPVEKRVSSIKAPTSTDKPKETPSIFNRKKPKESGEDATKSVVDKKEELFTEEELQVTWKAFSDLKSNAGDTERLILNKKVSKGNEHSVIIHLGSQLEVSFLEKIEVEMVQFLRTELSNDYITIKREILQEEESKKLYTSTDIFDYMVKQNPDLKDLKDRLGLDFDY